MWEKWMTRQNLLLVINQIVLLPKHNVILNSCAHRFVKVNHCQRIYPLKAKTHTSFSLNTNWIHGPVAIKIAPKTQGEKNQSVISFKHDAHDQSSMGSMCCAIRHGIDGRVLDIANYTETSDWPRLAMSVHQREQGPPLFKNPNGECRKAC
jgi:hypothetical protein